ncbi:MAG TPA: winged helix DNA-binding domain-containing protein [Opitutaceae bacterium]|nr:winged helix DNA-binding domain-containing protein [Opitutaceae bacterium]
MTAPEIGRLRLRSQQVAAPRARRPADVVRALGALQAQDYAGALWSIALRLPGSTEAEIERAVAEKSIVRTWPMRGTLHFVAAEDVRWMLALLAPRAIAASAGRQRQLGLTPETFRRCRSLCRKALAGGRTLAREELLAALGRGGVAMTPHRGYHILCRLAQEGFLCFGPRAGKRPTFALLDEWVPAAAPRERGEALAELARRYFAGHGPATLSDFSGWAGLTAADARAGLAGAAAGLREEKIGERSYWMDRGLPEEAEADGSAHLLPGFDEFVLGYKHRGDVLHQRHFARLVPGSNGIFQPTVVADGQVLGTWRREWRGEAAQVSVRPFRPLPAGVRRALKIPLERYGQFLGVPVKLVR